MEEFVTYMIIGFLAQLVDGALGMAYGVICTVSLLLVGLPPTSASAITHTAECVTTGFSAIAHHQLGNVHRQVFFGLLLPGMIGAIAGVLLLTHVPAEIIKPIVGLYLLAMGFIVLSKSFIVFPPRSLTSHLVPLGFFGAFMDATGGGGWGSIVTSTLLAKGHDPSKAIGSANACEFFIAVTASIAFFFSDVEIGWKQVAALAAGGAFAAPLGAYLCKHVPAKMLLVIVGVLIIVLSGRMLWFSFT